MQIDNRQTLLKLSGIGKHCIQCTGGLWTSAPYFKCISYCNVYSCSLERYQTWSLEIVPGGPGEVK